MQRSTFRLAAAALIITFFLAIAALPARTTNAAGCVSLATAGAANTQNFDTLANTAGSTTNSLTLTGWYLTESGGGARDNEQYAVDTGGSTTGDTYSYGSTGSGERALGGLRSGTLIPIFGGCFTNDTGATIASLAVAYTGEQWRLGTAARTDQINFEYSTSATSLTTGTWTGVAALNFVAPATATTGAKDGNAAANRTALSATIESLSIASGATFWLRWTDTDASSADDGLAVDDFSLTPGAAASPSLTINDVAVDEGSAGTTGYSFTVSLSAPAGAGGVTFDIATADGSAQAPGDYTAQALTGQTIAAGDSSYSFTVLGNGDTTAEPDETFVVNITNVTGATVADAQGQGTLLNDDLSKIHDVQGAGAASPVAGATVTVEGVVVADFQGAGQLEGFFLQEEDADADADPATSEGIFVFCNTCPTAVAEGQRVRATGVVSEFNNMTEITASSAGAVLVTDAGNHLAAVTPTPIDLPIVGDLDAFYEAREGMLVAFADTLTVAEYFELARYGQIELYAGERPYQFTETAAPSVAGYSAHLDSLARRRVILDDDNNTQQAYLAQPDGSQAAYYPQANGGFSHGTQGTDFFRGGDTVSGLTGVLHWSFPGTGDDTWRIRPTAANPVAFTAANPRPATPPEVGGAIKAASINLLNYFTTIDTTSSSSTGPCGPAASLDCRGADSTAELTRQRERAALVICSLDADVYAFMELENTTPADTINDLLGAVNARCGGTQPYAFVNTGGTLSTDAIRVALIYRSGVLAPVGAPLVDLNTVHNRPPTAQTFDVVDSASPAAGKRFTVVANHFKSKGCPGTGAPADDDAGDGQGCFNGTRTAQATRLLAWLSSTVLPAAGSSNLLLLGDFNAYAKEDPITTLTGDGFTDLAAQAGPDSYSYLFDGQLGHLDYAFANASLAPLVTGIGQWHINADEAPLFDYNDELRDSPGEAAFEEKPDGSALTPPRVLFQAASPYRASDHDPVLVGLFPTADLTLSKLATPDPIAAGDTLTYTLSLENAGPEAAVMVSLSDTLPAGTTFGALAAPGGWSCSTPATGAGGTIGCSRASLPVGSATFTLSVQVAASIAHGTVISNTASVASAASDPTPANNSATAAATVTNSAPAVTIEQAAGQADPAAGGPVLFTVTFSEPVTGFDQADVLIGGTAGATSAAVTGSGPTYTVAISGITAPGTVVATIAAGAAQDLAGTPSLASTSADNSVTIVDTAPPQAVSLAAANITSSGGTTHSFTVVFSDNLAIDVASLDGGDIRVTGPGGFSQLAALVSATPAGSGTPRTATYRINAPGGSWGSANNGSYSVAVVAGQVRDTAGNSVAAGTLGTFSVNIDPARRTIYLPLVQKAAPPRPSAGGLLWLGLIGALAAGAALRPNTF